MTHLKVTLSYHTDYEGEQIIPSLGFTLCCKSLLFSTVTFVCSVYRVVVREISVYHPRVKRSFDSSVPAPCDGYESRCHIAAQLYDDQLPTVFILGDNQR